MDDLEQLEERYANWEKPFEQRYARTRPEVAAVMSLMLEGFARMFRQHLAIPLGAARVLEVGTGMGTNVLLLLALGANPHTITANDLLSARLEAAGKTLPSAVAMLPGDAGVLQLPAASFDVIVVSTVFSSILEQHTRARVAVNLWRMLAPGGGILWYDFVRNNPRNHSVRRVHRADLAALFPDGSVHARPVTLAPPIARLTARISPALYRPLHAIRPLRTHLLAWVAKPGELTTAH